MPEGLHEDPWRGRSLSYEKCSPEAPISKLPAAIVLHPGASEGMPGGARPPAQRPAHRHRLAHRLAVLVVAQDHLADRSVAGARPLEAPRPSARGPRAGRPAPGRDRAARRRRGRRGGSRRRRRCRRARGAAALRRRGGVRSRGPQAAMWARSHTSGLMIGECIFASCCSLTASPRAQASARAPGPARQGLSSASVEGRMGGRRVDCHDSLAPHEVLKSPVRRVAGPGPVSLSSPR